MHRSAFIQNVGFLAGAVYEIDRFQPMISLAQNRQVAPGFQEGTLDPMAIQRSTLVVNGLDSSELNERYLDLLNAGRKVQKLDLAENTR